jgi:hypothetical protein
MITTPFRLRALPAALSASAFLGALFFTHVFGAEATVNWLEQKGPAVTTGVSFGVPWPQGAVKPGQPLVLTSTDGGTLPVQSWPLAYWPDGSLKWSGLATLASPTQAGPFTVKTVDQAASSGNAVRVSTTTDAVTVNTGRLIAKLPQQGPYLIESLTIDGREIARHGQLECLLQNAPDSDDRTTVVPRERYVSSVKKVTVEQSGPVRAVVKIEGLHRAEKGPREWLPFTVRLYFYAGEAPIRLVHTILFDGDKEKDFIRGLGLVFDVPMREQPQNRHVRFANSDGGLWAEPVLLPAFQGLGGGGRRGAAAPGGASSAPTPASTPPPNQLEGEKLGPTTSELAQWDAFKLSQLSSEGFTLVKRTNPKSAWIATAEGARAAGLVFAGDVSGGLAVSVKNFWQSYPASLEVQGATTDTAHLQVWLWSPDGPAMDMRHYDVRGHGPVNGGSGSYEDYEAEFATPLGVGRTSDLTLFPTANVPPRNETAAQALVGSVPPLLTVSPQYLHSLRAFGVWSLQDRSTPFKQEMEDRLDGTIAYYQDAIDVHHWYGFWDFGDVRHGYDAQRHSWRYDVGGYAWDNSELGSVLWLWYSYVRTGRADIFRMAEAMSRHNSDVDTYHFGRFAGLGSRHNVSHWGDSAKEARVSQAAHNRFYYYLTTDERVGDVLAEVYNADANASALDPMRKAQPKSEEEKKYPGRIRVGPDWLAFVGNWMTAWERTGDVKWKNKIQAGIDSMAAMPFWMRTGKNLVVGYDPATGKLYQVNDQPGVYNLPTIQGGAEVAFELTDLINQPQWTKMWLQYCRLGSAPADVLTKDQQTGSEGADASLIGETGGSNSQGSPRLAAYAYYKTKTPAFGQRAVEALTSQIRAIAFVNNPRRIGGAQTLNAFDEVPGMSTNDAAQSSLQTIEILEMCADLLPTAAPLPPTPPPSPFGPRSAAPPPPAK